MPAPEPNSPEALLAARKIRELFFFIVVMNLVLVAIVMCTGPDKKPEPSPAAKPAPATQDPPVPPTVEKPRP